MDGQNERCISCMEEKPVGKSCPNCGYTGEDGGQAPYLKMGVKLQNRYLVGRMLSFNGEGVSYIAYDLAEEAKILVREFFPQTVAFREDDGVTVSAMAGGEETFMYAKESFLAYTRKVAHCRDFPAILPVFDIFTENGTAYAVYEWCAGGTLKEYIERKGAPMSWNLAKALFLPLISSLKGIHAVGLGHYGISPENLFIFPDGKMKLGGFCVEDIRREERDLSPELFPGCAAIEQYSSNDPLAEYTDIYGFSACLFYALTMHLPQEATRRKYDSRLLISNSILQKIPPFVVSAMAAGLQVMPDKRVQTFEELYHQFVGGEVMNEAGEQTSIQASEPEEEPAPGEKEKKRLPDFALGAISFACALVVLCLCGWIYLKVRYGDAIFDFSGKASSETSESSELPDGSSMEPTSSAESGTESVESGDVSSVPDGSVAVPSYVGKTLEEAQKDKTFTVLLSGRDFNDAVAEGKIISQSVEGYAQPGSVVTVVVSKGPLMRKLPDVVGKTLEDAKAELSLNGFTVGNVTEEPSEKTSGTVLRLLDASLKAGSEYEYGTVVDLVTAQAIPAN